MLSILSRISRRQFLAGLAALSVVAPFAPTSLAAASSPSTQAQQFVDAQLAKMSLEEKIDQLRLVTIGPDYPRERALEDARAGRIGGVFNTVLPQQIRELQQAALASPRKVPLFFAYDVTHGHRSVFPISLGMASSWNPEVVELSARISAVEAAADGLDMTFSPMLDVTREPRWGRVSEGFGEDPYLISQYAKALVHGYQGDDLSAADSVMAVFKHFALYGAVEGGRDYNMVDMSPQRMFQDYLPPYQAAVDAGAGAVMVALSGINGLPSSANRWLLRDLLRKQWGFDGLVMSDHGAIYELQKYGISHDAAESSKLALDAGIEMDMNDDYFHHQLPDLVRSGKVDVAQVDAAARSVLLAKYRLGLFSDPWRRLGAPGNDPEDTHEESRMHRAQTLEVARQSLVLLKNADDLLPLAKQGRVAVVGPLADSAQDIIGSWSADGYARQAVSVYRGIHELLGKQAQVSLAKGANLTDDARVLHFLNQYETTVQVDPRPAQAMIDEAVAQARQADVVVAVLGEARGMAHESSSRSNLDLPGTQKALLAALKATGKPLVVVLLNGRPLSVGPEVEQSDALLEAWFPGTEGGRAVAEALFGDINPSGKLAMSFPRSAGQVPIYYNPLRIGRPFNPQKPDKYTSHYFDDAYGPLFPFGFGLSYTQFDVSTPELSADSLDANGRLQVSAWVKNTGKRAGATVLQLYIGDEVASSARPEKELRGFSRVELAPGERRKVSFTISVDDLKFWDAQMHHVAEPGRFRAMLGLDSQTLQSVEFSLR